MQVAANLRSKLVYFCVFLIFSTIAWNTPLQTSLDHRISDYIQQSEKIAANRDIVIVEIDNETLKHAGGFPVDRGFIARILQKLNDAGAKKIYLDLILTSEGGAGKNIKLAKSIELLGLARLAIPALNPTPRSPELKPLDLFSASAQLVGGEFFVDSDGWHRAVKSALTEGAQFENPARWLAGKFDNHTVQIDQRIDFESYRRVSMLDIANGKVNDLQDSIVVLGNSADIGGAAINYPVYGPMDRMTLIALATDTVLRNSEPKQWSIFQLMFTVLIVGLIAFIGAYWASNAYQFALVSVAGFMLIVGFTYVGVSRFQLVGHGVFFLSIWAAAFSIATMQKLRIAEVLREFYSGDLSPEEAWAWRTMDAHASPAILLSATGLKRQNKAALASKLFETINPAMKKQTLDSVEVLRQSVSQNQLQQPITIKINDKICYLKVSLPFEALPLLQVEDVTQNVLEARLLETRLETDPLTGCANRVKIEKELAFLEELKTAYTFILLDMNGFKAVNDIYGHQAGDDLLKIAAQRFQSKLRSEDILARLGGDEFAVLMPGVQQSVVAQRICDGLEASLKGSIDLGTQMVNIGVAAGYALSEQGVASANIIDQADKAMYARKLVIKAESTDAPVKLMTVAV